MAHLLTNPPNVNKDTFALEPSDHSLGSSVSDRSYNEWRYGEEASLYSIAEDSREDGPSELVSDATRSRTKRTTIAQPSSAAEIHVIDEASPVTPDDKGENMFEMPKIHSDRLPNSREEKDNDEYGRCPNLRRFRVSIAALCIVLFAVVLAISLTVPNDDASPSQVKSNLQDADAQGPPTVSPVTVPVASPTTVPPSRDWESVITSEARTRVLAAVSACTDESLLLDPSTVQGAALAQLTDEVSGDANVDDNSTGIDFSPNHSEEKLLEKFVLFVFFMLTDGESWFMQEGWGTESDVCMWTGILCEDSQEGPCEISGISMISNDLGGQLPKELCCLSCLDKLDLSFNRLGGVFPSCLNSIGLSSLYVDGNRFDGDDHSTQPQRVPTVFP